MNAENDHIRSLETVVSRKEPRHEIIRGIIQRRELSEFLKVPTRVLPYLLNICPIGDGALYEKLVLAALVRTLGAVIDCDLVRQRVPIEGGFADIELPFCIEALFECQHWVPWQRDYRIKAIIVEVKNLRKRASHEDANQLKGYVDGNHKGTCGLLVSRSGFTHKALRTLRSHADNGYLLLPLRHDDLIELTKISLDSSVKVVRYLRRIENLLSRAR